MIGRTRVRRLALALILVMAVGGLVYALTSGEPPDELATPRPSTTATVAISVPDETETATPRPDTPAPSLTDGIYAVGTEIEPGTYSTTAGGHPCYWARLRSFGQDDSIIDDDNLDPGEHARVVVKPTDRGFKVSNGCTWHQAL